MTFNISAAVFSLVSCLGISCVFAHQLEQMPAKQPEMITANASVSIPSWSSTPLRLMSWNLRWDSQPDNITIEETLASLDDASPVATPKKYYMNAQERPWSDRRVGVMNTIHFAKADLIGFQEAVIRQIDDLQKLLGSKFDWRGVGRADNSSSNASNSFDNEFGPVFWNVDLLSLQHWDTFWLSSTPFTVGSKISGAGNPRICTTARFFTPSGDITVMITHWDDQSDKARALGASLILRRAQFEAETTRRPVILLGDFNSPAQNISGGGSASTSTGYDVITGRIPPLEINPEFASRYPVSSNPFMFKDSRVTTPPRYISGDFATFTGFNSLNDVSQLKRIDFIMTGSNGGVETTTYKVGTNMYDDGNHLSDHCPVIVDATILEGDFGT